MQPVILQALSVIHPWGEKIASGEKTIEVRRWAPPGIPLDQLLIVENTHRLGPGESDPDGRAVAIVSIGAVGEWTPDLAASACSQWVPGWLAWSITRVKRIDRPFTVIADRGIYSVKVDPSLLPSDVE